MKAKTGDFLPVREVAQGFRAFGELQGKSKNCENSHAVRLGRSWRIFRTDTLVPSSQITTARLSLAGKFMIGFRSLTCRPGITYFLIVFLKNLLLSALAMLVYFDANT